MPRRRGNGQTEKKIETGRKHPVATGENLAIVTKTEPRIPAFRLRARSVRFIALAIFATGVRAFECALSSLTSSFDQGLPGAVVFFVGATISLMPCSSEEG